MKARHCGECRHFKDEEIDGKLYCPGCVEYDEETKSYKPKKKEL